MSWKRCMSLAWTVAALLPGSNLLAKDALPPIQECPVQRFSLPQTTTVKSCDKAACVVAGEVRICKCLQNGDAQILLQKSDKTFAKFSTNSYLGDTEDFDTLRTDLDGNGQSEWVIVNRDSISNGLSVRYWTATILPDDHPPEKAPLQFKLEDYGPGTFLKTGRAPGCEILVTRWEHAANSGVYFVGNFFRYDPTGIKEIPARPVLRRRLLNSFEKQRNASESEAKLPPYQLTPWIYLKGS